jgi:uncharacterized membrane protein (DUF106 family)
VIYLAIYAVVVTGLLIYRTFELARISEKLNEFEVKITEAIRSNDAAKLGL